MRRLFLVLAMLSLAGAAPPAGGTLPAPALTATGSGIGVKGAANPRITAIARRRAQLDREVDQLKKRMAKSRSEKEKRECAARIMGLERQMVIMERLQKRMAGPAAGSRCSRHSMTRTPVGGPADSGGAKR